jgi:hypothetical protein
MIIHLLRGSSKVATSSTEDDIIVRTDMKLLTLVVNW